MELATSGKSFLIKTPKNDKNWQSLQSYWKNKLGTVFL